MSITIGVIGFSSQTFKKEKARRYLNAAFDEICDEYDKEEVRVASGLTNLGVPRLAYEEAEKRDWETMGIACEKARDFELFDVDEMYIIGVDWGDESGLFLSLIDVLVCVGGGRQSVCELLKATRKNIRMYVYVL